MAAPRESLGAIPCLCCGQAIPVKRSTGGAISVCCSWCDLTAYAKEGSEAYRRIMRHFPKPDPAPAAPPAAAPTPPPPAAKPAPRKIPLFGG